MATEFGLQTASVESIKNHILNRSANIEMVDDRTFRYLPPALFRSALAHGITISKIVGNPSEAAIHNLDEFVNFSKSALEGLHRKNNLSVVAEYRGEACCAQTLSRSIIESSVLKAAFPSFLRCLDTRDVAALELLILRLHEALTGVRIGYRQLPVRTRRDKLLYAWEFPDHSLVRKQMSVLCEFICKSDRAIDLDLVVCVYGYINGLHPFGDGNGRVSRVFANLLINAAIGSRFNISFIPFRIMSTRFKGLHGMALRKELIYGRRDDLFDLFTQMITLWRDFASA